MCDTSALLCVEHNKQAEHMPAIMQLDHEQKLPGI
jgi:hypothetical protein